MGKLQNPDELNDGSLIHANGIDEDQDADDEDTESPTKVLLRLIRFDSSR